MYIALKHVQIRYCIRMAGQLQINRKMDLFILQVDLDQFEGKVLLVVNVAR